MICLAHYDVKTLTELFDLEIDAFPERVFVIKDKYDYSPYDNRRARLAAKYIQTTTNPSPDPNPNPNPSSNPQQQSFKALTERPSASPSIRKHIQWDRMRYNTQLLIYCDSSEPREASSTPYPHHNSNPSTKVGTKPLSKERQVSKGLYHNY